MSSDLIIKDINTRFDHADSNPIWRKGGSEKILTQKASTSRPKSFREFVERWTTTDSSLDVTLSLTTTSSSSHSDDSIVSTKDPSGEDVKSSKLKEEKAYWKQKTCSYPKDKLRTSIRHADAFFNLGKVRLDLDEAEAACLELSMAASIYKISLRQPELAVAKCNHWLSKALIKCKEYPRAESAAKRAFMIRKTVLGKDNVDTLDSCSLLASIFLIVNQVSQSVQLYQQVLNRRQKIFNYSHPCIATTATSLARACIAQGNIEESRLYLRIALEVARVSGQKRLAKIVEAELLRVGERLLV